jgi:hypothetical protein
VLAAGSCSFWRTYICLLLVLLGLLPKDQEGDPLKLRQQCMINIRMLMMLAGRTLLYVLCITTLQVLMEAAPCVASGPVLPSKSCAFLTS